MNMNELHTNDKVWIVLIEDE